jgi:predicted porin
MAAGGGRALAGDDERIALEERIAELEALSLRAGDRKFTVHLYGQVNRALLFWDDGFGKGWRGIDNSTSSSRFGFVGQTLVSPGITTGFRIELESDPPLEEGAAGTPGGGMWRQTNVRQAYGYVESQTYGRLSLGHQSPATDDITLINLGSQMNDAAVHYNSDSAIPLAIGSGLVTDLLWGQIAHNVDSLRGSFVRYDTPMLAGFLLSAAWGENEVWDAAIRYRKELGPFDFAGGVGVMDDRVRRFRDIRGSASLMHNPTGLYASIAGGVRDDDVSVLSADSLAHFHYIQAGISQQWFSFGKTTLYADYGMYKNFNVGELLRVDPHTGSLVIWGTLADTEVTRWGIGIEQAIDSAGLLLYAQAHHYDVTIIGFPCDANPGQFANNCGGDPANLVELPTRPWQAFVMGARIKF